MRLKNPAYDDICYNKNYLTDVIARVDFLSPIDYLKNKIPPKISNLIKKKFPIPEPRKIVAQELQISKDGIRDKEKKESMEWRFFGKEKEKMILMSPQALLITNKKYKTYEVLREDFFEIINAFFNHFEEAQGQRLGLRYINNISVDEGKTLDWNDLINNTLLHNIEFFPEKINVVKIFSETEIKLNDFNLKFKYGIHNPDYPAPVVKKSFILDYDAYSVSILNSNDITKSLDNYHKIIQEYFEKSITEKFREKLNHG